MISAGNLRLVLGWDGERVRGARVDNSRPLAAQLLVGREPVEAVALASTLFSLCGRAQAVAARRALAAAQAREAPALAADEFAVAAEAAQEHLWRIMLDWPQRFARSPQRDRFARLHRQLGAAVDPPRVLAQALREVVAESGLADPAADTVERLAERATAAGELGRMMAQVISADVAAPALETVPLMPLRSAMDWAAGFDGDLPSADYCARPTLAGAPAETGALARRQDRPAVAALHASGRRVAARLAARFSELTDLAERLDGAAGWPLADGAPIGNGLGLARVETARGLLLHAARVNKGRITGYAIVAPTEWNFHPAGVFVREVQGLCAHDRDALLSRAQVLALALDPCVAWEIVVEDVADA